MWVWWILSLIIVTASVVFSLYIFYSGYKAPAVKKEFHFRKTFDLIRPSLPLSKSQVIASLKLKLQSVEQNSVLYYNELKKMQQRIQALEKGNSPYQGYQKPNPVSFDENWEELYYQASEQKEKLENELDLSNQKLEETEELVMELKRRETAWKEKRSELENQLNKAHSLQNKIGDLQREIESAAQKEQALLEQIEQQKNVYHDFELLQQQYASVQSEADELKNRIKEITNRDVLLQQKINKLTELESTIEISEYEKMDIRKSIEDIIVENEALAAKLQDLQEKLNLEKFV